MIFLHVYILLMYYWPPRYGHISIPVTVTLGKGGGGGGLLAFKGIQRPPSPKRSHHYMMCRGLQVGWGNGHELKFPHADITQRYNYTMLEWFLWPGLVSYPDPILCEGKGLVTSEWFLSCVHQNYIILLHVLVLAVSDIWVAEDSLILLVMKLYHRRHSFNIKPSVQGIVWGTGHMTTESAQPRKLSNVTRSFPSQRVGSGYETKPG